MSGSNPSQSQNYKTRFAALRLDALAVLNALGLSAHQHCASALSLAERYDAIMMLLKPRIASSMVLKHATSSALFIGGPLAAYSSCEASRGHRAS